MKLLLSFVIIVFIEIFSLKVTGRKTDGSLIRSQKVNQYLYSYGYLKNKEPTIEKLQDALRKFQEVTNIPVTGEIDDDTLTLMERPRCGDPDNVPEDRFKRFVLKGSRWKKTTLSFGIYKYPTNSQNNMTNDEIWEVITKAFEHWENATNIRFQGVGPGIVDKSDVDIAIGWELYIHGDDLPFDGPDGKILAHGFFPDFGGDLHFDDSEVWGLITSTQVMKNYNKTTIELFQTALHEIGHILGLDHSTDNKSVMWPYLYLPEGRERKEGLTDDDIQGVESLYGKRTGENETVAYGTYEANICDIVKFDAVKEEIIFVRDKYWIVTEDFNYILPQNISDTWEDLPGDLDAAVYNNEVFYFFKGDHVYAYGKGQTKLLFGFPKKISDTFLGFPNNLDGAFSFGNEVYYVKGDYFGIDFNQTKFPNHSTVVPPFDDVFILTLDHDHYLRIIKNGKVFGYKDLSGNDIKLSSMDDLNGPKFEQTNMYAADLRYNWFQWKRDDVYDGEHQDDLYDSEHKNDIYDDEHKDEIYDGEHKDDIYDHEQPTFLLLNASSLSCPALVLLSYCILMLYIGF